MSRFKIGDKVVINTNNFDGDNPAEQELGYSPEMEEQNGKTAIIEDISRDRVYLDIDAGEHTWHENWFDKPKMKIQTSVNFDMVKELQRLLTENIITQLGREDFDGRAFKDSPVVYAQQTDEKDTLSKERTILKGMFYTYKLEEINRNKDFFVLQYGILKLFGNRKMTIFKNVPLLKMAEPTKTKKEKPKSLYGIKSKDVDADLLITIQKLIEKAKECDIDADIYFMLESIRTKKDIFDTMIGVLGMSHRKYDAKAKNIFSTILYLVESL